MANRVGGVELARVVGAVGLSTMVVVMSAAVAVWLTRAQVAEECRLACRSHDFVWGTLEHDRCVCSDGHAK